MNNLNNLQTTIALCAWMVSTIGFGYILNKVAPLLVILAPFLGFCLTVLVVSAYRTM